jgi:hypothetical protein
MTPLIRSTALAATALAGALLLAMPQAHAQAGVTLGSLTCLSEGSTGYIIGSSENVACTFTPANDAAAEETYVGTLNQFGLDIGVTGETVMEWVVLAGSADVYQPGILAGRYVGASANASFAAGGGANLLVGGPSDGLTLQPLSLQAQEGVNAAVGVSEFTLAPAVEVVPAPGVVVVE